jgi:benzoyl-CoA reductase subunit D
VNAVAHESLLTGGLDVGARSIKIAILSHQESGPVVLAKALVRIQKRHEARVDETAIHEAWRRVLSEAGLAPADIDCVASTGAPDRQAIQVGRHYERSSHAFGARMLFPGAVAALDIGANRIRCAFLRKPMVGCRYALTRLTTESGDEMWEATARGSGLIFGNELATRAVGLVRTLAVAGNLVLTGGMVLDADFVRRFWGLLLESESEVSLLMSPEAVFAGAFGAAVLAARRFRRLSRASSPVDPLAPLAQRLLRFDRRTLN